MDGLPSLKEAMPYMLRQIVRMTTSPAAASEPAAPAYSVLRRGPVFMKGPTRKNPWARPTSIPRSSGLTAVRYAGRLERYHAISGLDVIGVSRLPINGSPFKGWITWNVGCAHNAIKQE